MRNFWALLRRELRCYFVSPLFYVVAAAFYTISGLHFYYDLDFFVNFGFGVSILENFWQRFLVHAVESVLVAVPFLTMRLFAEEKKLGTIELLYTYPLRDGEILAAKFAACEAVVALMLTPTFLYALFVHAVQPFPLQPILAAYLGLLLLTAACVACGTFISSLTDSQVVAGIATFGVLVLFWILSWNEAALRVAVGAVLVHLHKMDHFEFFTRGVINAGDVSYFVFFAAVFSFLTLRSMESRTWRGRR